MKTFSALFQTEKNHFNRLSEYGKDLVTSYFFYSLASPIYVIFTNAFIWRETHNVAILAIYNLTIFAGSSIGYFLNWLCLKKLYPPQMYFIGAFTQITSVALLVFFGVVNTYGAAIIGLIYGISSGLYWANRLTLTLRIVSRSENRMYFTSLDQTFNSLSGIVIPLLVGLIIVFGENNNFYSPTEGYYIVVLLGMVAIYLAGIQVHKIQLKLPSISEIILKKTTAKWNKIRTMVFVSGVLYGIIAFVPTLLVLKFIGREDALGIVQSLSAVIAAIVIYNLAKRIKTKQRLFVYGAGVFLGLLASSNHALLFSTAGVFIFFIFISFATPLMNMSYFSFLYDSIDEESKEKNNHYAHIFDAEVFLNLGRITGILLFLLLLLAISESFALRFSLLFFTLLQIVLLVALHKFEKHTRSHVIEYTKGEAIP